MSLLHTKRRVRAAQKDRNGYPLMPIQSLSLTDTEQNLRTGEVQSAVKVTGRRANVTVLSSGAPLHVTANRGARVTVLHDDGELTVVSRGGAVVDVFSIKGKVQLLVAGGSASVESLYSEVRGKVKSGTAKVCTGTGNVDVKGACKNSRKPLPLPSEC